jgi:hypothetical protein
VIQQSDSFNHWIFGSEHSCFEESSNDFATLVMIYMNKINLCNLISMFANKSILYNIIYIWTMMKLFHQSLESRFYRYRIRFKKNRNCPAASKHASHGHSNICCQDSGLNLSLGGLFPPTTNHQKSEIHRIVKWDINGITNEKWIEMV